MTKDANLARFLLHVTYYITLLHISIQNQYRDQKQKTHRVKINM